MRTIYSQDQLKLTRSLSKIIGDTNNILILYELINFGEKSFNELKRMTEINPVTLSKKLNNLKELGYVDSIKVGKENHYYAAVGSDKLKPIIKEIEKIVVNN